MSIFAQFLIMLLSMALDPMDLDRRRLDLKQPKGALPLIGHLRLLTSVPSTEIHQFFEKHNNELGLFTSEGPKWLFQHQIWSNVFKVMALREYVNNVFVVEGKKVVDILGKAADEGIIVDLQHLMMSYTMDVLGGCTFGKSFGCLDSTEQMGLFIRTFKDLLEILTDHMDGPLWKIRERLDGTHKKTQDNRQILRGYAQEIMNKRRREGYHSEKKDLLQLFIEGKDDEGENMSDELIMDNIITLL
ncbi:Protein kinase alk2, partial [Mortierella sp. AD094]